MIETGIHNGEVIWYNDRRGYGFISIGEDEIFIHRSVLEKFGLTFLYSGDQITVQVVVADNTSAITEIRSVAREEPVILPSDTKLHEDEVEGIVKFFNPIKGYGFIALTGDAQATDVFVHSRTLQACDMRTLAEGQRILLSITDDGKGPQARAVRIIATD